MLLLGRLELFWEMFIAKHLENAGFTPEGYGAIGLAILAETFIVRLSNIDSLSIPRHGNLQVNSVQ